MVWIVMTSSARSAGRQFGTYRNVAMVQLAQHYTARDLRPPQIKRACRMTLPALAALALGFVVGLLIILAIIRRR